ncbi:hypothetical protein [Lichenibacterium ramalinae]|uniref:Uncharacterized protein n=1 Tax=Lichenibacterium ramalinae TaxID=2316527 RepID=A0A4Q2R6Q5_9HYPH|nr:hypothetical protein [Lichenibacterium ramalinae]RYB02245.1 hypothetical protein D3272_21405 [Lichenibacterium ramalinae]
MRFRSEWLTLFTLTAVAVGAVSLPRGLAPAAVAFAPGAGTAGAVARRADLMAAGVDLMPIGTARAVGRAKSLRARPMPDRP